jgi:rSAM/selenodomain-associated transferase 1
MVDVANADTVAVLTRAPSSGGKSRLFAALGRPPDPGLLAALLLDTIDGVTMPGVRVVVAVTPVDACEEVARLIAGPQTEAADRAMRNVPVVGQPDGDLGDRMRGTMARLLDAGARAVVLVGSDLPAITHEPVRAAFDLLEQDRDLLVLGPALDGGYYLVAATRVPRVFEKIIWGSPDVLEQTCSAAARAGMRVHFVGTVADVDTLDDLRCVPGSSRTAAWMRRNGLVR